MALTDTGINAYAIPKQCKARMPLKPANKFSFLQSPIPSTPFLHLSFPPSLPPLLLSVPLSHVCALGSGPRYQILSHVFARCASQKTHGHARIARETRAKKCDTNHIPRSTGHCASREHARMDTFARACKTTPGPATVYAVLEHLPPCHP